MGIVAIVQCRETSTRFQSKCWSLLHGKPIIRWVVEALKRCVTLDGVYVASPHPLGDDPGCPVLVYSGTDDDVLARYVAAADETSAEAVVRITGDCPLIKSDQVDTIVRYFKNAGADYATNILGRRDSDGYGDGFDIEVVRTSILRALLRAAQKSDREHVTSAIRAELWKYLTVGVPYDLPAGKWSVDTPQDLARIERMTDSQCRIISSQAVRVPSARLA